MLAALVDGLWVLFEVIFLLKRIHPNMNGGNCRRFVSRSPSGFDDFSRTKGYVFLFSWNDTIHDFY